MEAQFKLGKLLSPGYTDLHPSDESESRKWLALSAKAFRPAADAGNAHAQFRLGQVLAALAGRYEHGDSAKRPAYREAARWYERAAETGYLGEAASEAATIYEIHLEDLSKARTLTARRAVLALAGSALAEFASKRLDEDLNDLRESERPPDNARRKNKASAPRDNGKSRRSSAHRSSASGRNGARSSMIWYRASTRRPPSVSSKTPPSLSNST